MARLLIETVERMLQRERRLCELPRSSTVLMCLSTELNSIFQLLNAWNDTSLRLCVRCVQGLLDDEAPRNARTLSLVDVNQLQISLRKRKLISRRSTLISC
jgi:hypothetical protein